MSERTPVNAEPSFLTRTAAPNGRQERIERMLKELSEAMAWGYETDDYIDSGFREEAREILEMPIEGIGVNIETIESLYRSLSEMVSYRYALRLVTERLLKYAEGTYPRCPEDSTRELKESDRRKILIADAREILYETFISTECPINARPVVCKCKSLKVEGLCLACVEMLRQQLQRQKDINLELVESGEARADGQ